MSLASWRKEFYPIPASKCKEKDALDHSIRKWEGLTKKNLRKHGLLPAYGTLYEALYDEKGNRFEVSGASCALCFRFDPPDGRRCAGCPIVEVCGRICCETLTTEDHSPYGEFTSFGNPRPMLNLLRKTKRVLARKGSK